VGIAKIEYPPLLKPGFHDYGPVSLRQLCVLPFPASSTRGEIMDGLDAVTAKLAADAIAGELWVDGSFLTEKIDPEDSDVVLVVTDDFVQHATVDQRASLGWFGGDLKSTYKCDSYVHVEFPPGHPRFGYGEWMKAYWIKQFGFSRTDELKGMAVLTVP
jgi:hypothetical protein